MRLLRSPANSLRSAHMWSSVRTPASVSRLLVPNQSWLRLLLPRGRRVTQKHVFKYMLPAQRQQPIVACCRRGFVPRVWSLTGIGRIGKLSPSNHKSRATAMHPSAAARDHPRPFVCRRRLPRAAGSSRPLRGHNGLILIRLDTVGSPCRQAARRPACLGDSRR